MPKLMLVSPLYSRWADGHTALPGWRSMPKPAGDTAIGGSPFVTKLEAWLRFANIPYTYVGVGDPSTAPKGQVSSHAALLPFMSCNLYCVMPRCHEAANTQLTLALMWHQTCCKQNLQHLFNSCSWVFCPVLCI